LNIVRYNVKHLLNFCCQIPGTTQDHLQVFHIEAKTKIKSHFLLQGFPGWLLQCQKVKKRPISFIQNKAGIWVLEDACRKEGPFAKMKAKINQGWD
jgi:hypothetical protein